MVRGVIITDPRYSFACGLRPGMDVESVYDCGLRIDEDPNPDFDPVKKNSVTWINDIMGGIFSKLGVEGELNSLTYNFNLFEVNAYSKKKPGDSYTPIKGGQTPISIYLKGDKVVAVGTQIPF